MGCTGQLLEKDFILVNPVTHPYLLDFFWGYLLINPYIFNKSNSILASPLILSYHSREDLVAIVFVVENLNPSLYEKFGGSDRW